ncbi:MAG: NUDIX hydrolase [Solirubrobacterales bacterium]|nr:NUDIX hydrolase [Solirubrobacterales bacterium]
MSSRFERTGSETVYEGMVVSVRLDTFRHEDGEEVTREIVSNRGAVAVVAHDGERLHLVRQPREAVGAHDLLELPAGKLDVEGETPLQTARRELAEEIGKAASSWSLLAMYFTSPGFTDEQVHVFEATGLTDHAAETEENERIEIVTHPLSDLDALIDGVRDAKTLVGLLELRRRMTVRPGTRER